MNHDTNPTSSDSRKKDVVRLLLLLVLATLPRVWMVTHTAVVSRDTLVFSRYAVNLAGYPKNKDDGLPMLGEPQDIVRRAEHPPGFPVTVLLTQKLLFGSTKPTPPSIILSAQVAGVAASLLLIIPLYFLGKQLYGGLLSFFAVGIFSVLPVWVEVSANGISDPLALLFGVMAIWSLLNAFRGKWFSLVYSSILSGWFVGLGFLVRPDAAVLGLALGLVVLVRLVGSLKSKSDKREWIRSLVCGLLLTSATLSIMLPYRALIGRWTNKRTGDVLLDTLKGEEVEKDIHKRNIPGVGLAPAGVPLFATWRTNQDPSKTEAMVWSVKAITIEFLKGSFYVFPLLGLIGFFILIRKQPIPEENPLLKQGSNACFLVWILVLWALLHAAILVLVAFRAGYLSERHTLPIVLVCLLFAGRGLWAYGAWLSRLFRMGNALQWTTIAAVILLLTPFVLSFKSLHKSRLGHAIGGEWLHENQNVDYWLIDPYGWVGFYSGRAMELPPRIDPTGGPKQYVVWEPNSKEPESKTPFYDVAKTLVQNGKIVFAYPPNAPPEKIQIAIYECEPLK